MTMLWALSLPAQWRTPWSYSGDKGPERWGDLDPDYVGCKTGREQSPVDIRETQKADLPALQFEYRSGPVKIINNGYTAVRVNYASGNGNYLFAGDRRYELTQFHFHHPSEERIRGKSYDMVLHLMHRTEDGKAAGVAIFLMIGSKNSTVEELWKHIPQSAGPEHEIPGLELNPVTLLPRDLAYYTYTGSQTAPPCTEGVTWFVIKQPLEISMEQVNAFAKLYPHDVRPTQPLNGRSVQESR
jgi:carbonic anhydrase